MADFLNNRFNMNTYNSMFPWLNKSNYDKVIAYGNSLWLEDEEEKKRAENNYYRKNVNKMVNDQILDERDNEINQQSYQAATLNSEWANEELRKTELSQALKRKYNLDAKANDKDVFDDFAEWLNDQWKKLLAEYVAWKSNEFLYVSWLAERPQEEEKKEEVKVEDDGKQYSWLATHKNELWELWTGILQSPWKRGYNLIGQWIDRAWKEIADKLDWTMAKDAIMNLAKMTFWEEEIKKYQEEKAKQLAEWTAFKGREATDIRTPILWEERANSDWTKAWETIWDIATWIAVTAPIWAALAPTIAGSSLWWAAGIWALEWLADTAITQLWSEWNMDLDASQVLLWAWWWAIGWMLTRYLANLPAKQVKDIKKEASQYIEKSIKPTVKWKQSQSAYNAFIDDTLDVTDYMSKNKQVLQYTDDAWEVVKWELPRNMRETSEALGNMKKYIYDQYNKIAQEAWDKWARVSLNKVYDKLDELANNKAVNLANPWLKNAIESYKNQLLQYSDDLGNISIQEAQDTMQYYNKILDAYFKNPWAMATDTSKNIVVANLKKSLADAVDDSMDDALNTAIKNWSTASEQYRWWKQLYSKIKTIEDEVSKRALVEMRKNTKWLSTDIVEALAWGNIVEWLLTQNPTWFIKWTVMKWINAYNKYLNSPNTQLRNLFNLVDRVNNPSAVATAITGKVWTNWTPIVWWVTNSIEEWVNTYINS